MYPRRPTLALLAGALGLSLGLASCGAPGQTGDCGPLLSAGECQVVRNQLGALDLQPPPDPTSKVGRWTGGMNADKALEDKAAIVGQRLFFDFCLSQAKNTACSTCHEGGSALIDPRPHLMTAEMTLSSGTKVRQAQIRFRSGAPLTGEAIGTPPPLVEALTDPTGTPLARWNDTAKTWEAVQRRGQSSLASDGKAYTARNSPTLYNVAFGAAALPADGARTAGVTWVPWDGRYDSVWALVADVWEFGATHRTNRAHVARRIFQKHRSVYLDAFPDAPQLDFDRVTATNPPKLYYPRNASPNTAFTPDWVTCWRGGPCPKDVKKNLDIAPLTDPVRQDINATFANAGKALSAYLRRLRSGNAAYDRWLRNDLDSAQKCDRAQPLCPDGETCDLQRGRCTMSTAAQRGLRLFIGKAECIMCHGGPNFTDWRFHNLGVPAYDAERRTAGSEVVEGSACDQPGAAPSTLCADQGRYAWQNRLAGACELPADGKGTVLRDEMGVIRPHTCQRSDGLSCFSYNLDVSRPYADADKKQCLPVDLCLYDNKAGCERAGCLFYDGVVPGDNVRACVPRASKPDLGAFKTPSLRNVARTWPYMHNGALFDYSLAERDPPDCQTAECKARREDPTPHLLRVIAFYNQGGGAPVNGQRDPLIRPLHLTPSEMSDLAEFLKALTDESPALGDLLRMPDDLKAPKEPTECQELFD